MRYLLLLLIGVLVFLFWRAVLRRPDDNALVTPPEPKSGDMVQCRHCGVYLPEADALNAGAFYYCSAEHRDEDQPGDCS